MSKKVRIPNALKKYDTETEQPNELANSTPTPPRKKVLQLLQNTAFRKIMNKYSILHGMLMYQWSVMLDYPEHLVIKEVSHD